MTQPLLTISHLCVSVDNMLIIKGLDLTIMPGQVHAIMGPNGSGKSTLSYALMGHPAYQIEQGSITFDGQDLSELSVDQRARKGIFLAFQYPYEVEGLVLKDFLRQAYNAWYGVRISELVG